MAQLSNALRTQMLNDKGVSELLTGGSLFIFAGPVPANADAELDMVSDHTLLAVIDDSGGGLTFGTPANGVLSKSSGQTWSGLVDFVGAEAGAGSLAATFYRFCAAADDGQTAGGSSTYRVQGTAGGPSDAAEMDVGSATLVDNGTNTVTLTVGNLRMPSA